MLLVDDAYQQFYMYFGDGYYDIGSCKCNLYESLYIMQNITS